MSILVRILGIAGLITGVIPFQFKRHKHIVLCKGLSTVFFATQYFVLGGYFRVPGAYTGAWMDLVSSTRNYLFYKFVEKKWSTLPVILFFCLLLVTITAFSWGGWFSLLPLIAKLLSTVSYGMKNERLLRLITFPSCILWVIYNCIVGSYEAAVGDGLSFLSIMIAIYKFDIRKPKTAKQ
ncbi:MAG: YgjV family protein [Clostridia bacterium]|nr:YgjV family protein [Clostridia bacterium]